MMLTVRAVAYIVISNMMLTVRVIAYIVISSMMLILGADSDSESCGLHCDLKHDTDS
jgi:hypothetical protein